MKVVNVKEWPACEDKKRFRAAHSFPLPRRLGPPCTQSAFVIRFLPQVPQVAHLRAKMAAMTACQLHHLRNAHIAAPDMAGLLHCTPQHVPRAPCSSYSRMHAPRQGRSASRLAASVDGPPPDVFGFEQDAASDDDDEEPPFEAASVYDDDGDYSEHSPAAVAPHLAE